MEAPRNLLARASLLLAPLAAACDGPGVAEAGGPRPPLLLVALDSVPARLTGLLGGTEYTPVLDRLARESLSYEACLAPEPWSANSLAAALRSAPAGTTDAESLAARLARAGYRTCAVVAHDVLAEAPGLLDGFETVERLAEGDPAGALGHDAADAALALLDERDPRPPFVLVHLADARPPHHLYPGVVPEADAPYGGPVRAGLPHAELLRLAPGFDAEDVARLRALAASEVCAADAALGRLLDGLARRGLARDTAVVVLGTRGAWLGERGRVGLVPGLEPEVLHVPFVLHVPVELRAPTDDVVGRVDLPVTLLDLAPTLQDLLGLDGHPGQVGRSVLPGAPAPARVLHLASGRARPEAAAYGAGLGVVRDLETREDRVVAWPAGAAGAADEGALVLALDDRLRGE